MGLETFGRDEFLDDVWDYHAGEHVTFLAPTGAGKTELKWGLLRVTATPNVPAVVLASKPKDRTTSTWMRKLDYRKVQSFPPATNPFRKKPSGYVLWPKHTFDPDVDDAHQARVFSGALRYVYKHGKYIVDVDEMLDMKDLGLERDERTLWTRGRSMDAGLWSGSQQPFHVPTYAYRQAQHMFIAKDPDKRSRQRFDEIGGFDSGLVGRWVMSLQKFQFLYLRRADGAACIVDKF